MQVVVLKILKFWKHYIRVTHFAMADRINLSKTAILSSKDKFLMTSQFIAGIDHHVLFFGTSQS